MRRILLLLAAAAMILALTAGPAVAAAGVVEGLPEGSCPAGGDWDNKIQQLPGGSAGEVTLANDTPNQCFHELENFQENPVFHECENPEVSTEGCIYPWPPEIQVEDNTRHNKE
jgi:hypothetical protein